MFESGWSYNSSMIGWRQAIVLITVERSWRNSVLRVGLALPMTPWPVLLAIRDQGRVLRAGGRHSAGALHTVLTPALWILLLTHLAAILAILVPRISTEAKLLLSALVIIHLCLIVAFLLNNSPAYA